MNALTRSLLVGGLLVLWVGPAPAYAATFTVNSTTDGGDSSPGDGVCNDGTGNCTLRAAIQEANANVTHDTINFSIASGVQTIAPASPLPSKAVGLDLTIDGTTQPGYAGAPLIELNGSGAGAANGLAVSLAKLTVRGLVINRFSGHGIFMSTLLGWCGRDVTNETHAVKSERRVFLFR